MQARLAIPGLACALPHQHIPEKSVGGAPQQFLKGAAVATQTKSGPGTGVIVVLVVLAAIGITSAKAKKGREGEPEPKPSPTIVNPGPSVKPGRNSLTLTLSWKGPQKPDCWYSVSGEMRECDKIAGSRYGGTYNHSVPYVPGAEYSIHGYQDDPGDFDCFIAVNGKTYVHNHRKDPGGMTCWMNHPSTGLNYWAPYDK